MKGFDQKDTNPYPNYTHVKEYFTDESLFSFYMNMPFSIGTFNSPIGATDRKASFSIFYNHMKGKYMFKEFRYDLIGDAIDLVQYMYNYTTPRRACMRIMHDFGIEGFSIDRDIASLPASGTGIERTKKVSPPKREIELQVQTRSWTTDDIAFWMQYGITYAWIRRANIHPIKYYFINGNLRYADRLAYVYVEKKDGKITYKVYQPYSDRKKWLSNNDSSVWELWELLPAFGSVLIITKSRKDALSIMATLGVPSCSLQSEGTMPKPQVMAELKARFDKVYLLYDNDFSKDTNYGQEYSQKFAQEYDLINIRIPDKWGEKDYSDLVKKQGIDKAKQIIIDVVKNEIKN